MAVPTRRCRRQPVPAVRRSPVDSRAAYTKMAAETSYCIRSLRDQLLHGTAVETHWQWQSIGVCGLPK